MTKPEPKLPRRGQLWQDSAGQFHRVLTVATAHAGLTPLVVYQQVHAPFGSTWACTVPEFLGVRNDGTRNFVQVVNDDEQDLWNVLESVLPANVIQSALDCYDEPWRHYHARTHVVGLFSFARQHQFSLTPAQAVALLFHDVVYIPGAQKGANEHASVALMRLMCGGLDRPVLDEAASIILDTITHVPSTANSSLVLDLDLSCFVSAAQGLLDPSREVWDEYRPLLPVSDTEAAGLFWEVRGAMLRTLMERKPLYVSAQFRGNPSLELHARAHLQAELARAQAAAPLAPSSA